MAARVRAGGRARWPGTFAWVLVAVASALAALASALAMARGAALPRRTSAPVSRAAMAEGVVRALGLAPTALGPPYRDVAATAAYADAVAAGADAALWTPPWRPGARFRPGAGATFGEALGALLRGLGAGRVVADLPDGERLAAGALGLWPERAPALSAPLTPRLLAWLDGRARRARQTRGRALSALLARSVRAVVWDRATDDVVAGEPVWVKAVAVDRAGYALAVPLATRASAGVFDNAAASYTAPDRAGQVVLTARAPNGVHARLRLTVVAVRGFGFAPALPRVVVAGRSLVLEAAVFDRGDVVTADDGRTFTLEERPAGGTRARIWRVDDQGGLAPFPLGPFARGTPSVRLTLTVQGLGTRVYVVRVTPATPAGRGAASGAARGGGGPGGPARAVRAAAQVAGKGLWLPYWVWKTSPRRAPWLAQARRTGVRTIYIEVATSADGFYGAPALRALVPAARSAGVAIVAWLYADLASPQADLDNLSAVARWRGPGGARPVGIALDLEGAAPLPGWALVDELATARRLFGRSHVVAVVEPPGAFAPPYARIARYARAVVPMDYWHGEMAPVGYDRAYAYVAATVRAIRAAGVTVPIAPALQGFDAYSASGVGPYAPTAAELAGAAAGAASAGAAGVSFYQWGTLSPSEWRVVAAPWPAAPAAPTFLPRRRRGR